MAPSRRARTEPYSYLHRDTVLVGDLTTEGRVRIDGTVRGAVRSGGVLEIAPGGRIEGGPVHAVEVRIAGSVLGDVHAEGRAEIWKGGLVEGDVHAASLDVEEGARFRGRSLMHGDEPDAAAPARAATPDAGARASEGGSDALPPRRPDGGGRREASLDRAGDAARPAVRAAFDGDAAG